ncbi:MAG: lipopolysaccharide heptosyltransferase II [Deltaproteobacteria bacterium]|jgi:heptosyltransferase-1|nr:lipopolysaccharide heptosyltransferase II [Deltaproteobacteria bacterium]
MNILIIKLSSIGDCLLATPAVESIRKGYPDSFITWLIEDKAKDIALLNPHVDEVVIIDKKNFKFKNYLSLIKKLRSRRYDLSIDLQGVDRTSIFSFLSGAPARYVEEYAKLGFLSNKRIARKGRPLEHAVKFYLFLAEKCGGKKNESAQLTLITSEEDKKFASDFLETNFVKSEKKEIFIGINPTGTWKTKRWPVKYFIELSKKLINSFNANIVIFGGKGEKYLADEILNALSGNVSKVNVVSAVGKTTLKQAKELLAKMDYFITPDSGLMHIASAVETLKTIALFGPTDPELTGPVGKNFTVLKDNILCIPCFQKECPLNKIENNNLTECVLCMKRITPDIVFRIIKQDYEKFK